MRCRVFLLCALLQPWLALAADELRLATSEWPPFTGKTSERHIAEDLVELALAQVGVDFTIAIEPWDVALAGVQDGRYDGLVAAWYSPGRARSLKYSKPILENRILPVTLEGSDPGVVSIADLAGKAVGLVAGYTYGEELDGAKKAGVVEYKNEKLALQHLLTGEVDVVLVDDLSLRYLLRDMTHEQMARFRPQRILAVLELHFVLNKTLANASAIISSFNRAIDTMVADGTYNRVLELSWVLADTDNDGIQEYIAHGEQATGLSPPHGDDHYQVYQDESQLDLSPRRVYRVGGQQYDSWDDAKEAIIDDYQTEPSDRMIQDNRYQIGVPL